MGKRTSLETKLLAAYLSGYKAGIDAMTRRAGEIDITPDEPDGAWKECDYLVDTTDSSCLGKFEMDSCDKEKCSHIHLKKKEGQ